jgi:hypothetical protein
VMSTRIHQLLDDGSEEQLGRCRQLSKPSADGLAPPVVRKHR